MEWVETTGRTVAEALDAALDQLGVDEQEAEVQVLQEPQKGLFGRLRGEARVRARVRPTRPRPKMERRDRRRRGERDRRGRDSSSPTAGKSSSGKSSSGKTQESRSRSRTRASGNGDARRAERNGKGGRAAEREPANGEATSDEAKPTTAKSRKRRRRGRGGGAKEQGAAVINQSSEAATGAVAAVPEMDAQREAVDEFLRGLVDAFGRPEVSVSVRTDEDDTLEAEVNGDELGLLVGPKGQTLQAVHELVRSMVQRRFVGQPHARVRVDVAGYRQRRREALERFTLTIVEQVRSTGRAAVLDPMAASDRKVVHDVVNDIDGVETSSEGEEPARRVIVRLVTD